MNRRMTEGELESALCRAFSVLLPDLFAEGYRIESQQAILLGRRIDLLLRKPDGSACVIELKAGSPPMPQVRDQILDYAKCWRMSYRAHTSLRLIVIGNSIPKNTESELAKFGVESRAITPAKVLAALQQCQPDGPAVAKGLKLIPNNPDKVRHLLSNYDAVTVPHEI